MDYCFRCQMAHLQGEHLGQHRFNYRLARHEEMTVFGWEPTHATQIVGIDPAAPPPDEIQRLSLQTCKDLTRDLEAVRIDRDAFQMACRNLQENNAALRSQVNKMARQEIENLIEIAELCRRLSLPLELGDHDYHGPSERDPETGRQVSVRDTVHERVYAVVGDILAGRVIQAARRQLQEALKSAPKDPVTLNLQTDDDPRRIGWQGKMTDAV